MNFEKFRKQHFEVEKRIWEIVLLLYKHNKNKCPELPRFFEFSFGLVFVHLRLKINSKESSKLAFPFEWLEMSDDKVVVHILEEKKSMVVTSTK